MTKRFYWMACALLASVPTVALAQQKLSNPLGEGATIETVIARVIKALLGLSGTAALLMFVWGGFLWLTSRGETTQINKGKDTLKWAVFGLAMIFFAYVLVQAVITALTEGTALETPKE